MAGDGGGTLDLAEGAKAVGVFVPGTSRGRGTGMGRVDPGGEIMAGVAAAAQHVGAKVLGGDLRRSERYRGRVRVRDGATSRASRNGRMPGTACG